MVTKGTCVPTVSGNIKTINAVKDTWKTVITKILRSEVNKAHFLSIDDLNEEKESQKVAFLIER